MSLSDRYAEHFEEYDCMERDFIDDELIWGQLEAAAEPTLEEVRAVLRKAEGSVRLDLQDTAILIQNQDPETIAEMFGLARRLKQDVYGDRIVFFAPLYVSDECANNCTYCGFRSSNAIMRRTTLTTEEIEREVQLMIAEGQKRTILVYGESPKTGIDYLCDSIRTVYGVKCDNGEIRRANVNCAPLSRGDAARLKEAGSGTYQVFQETYHHDTYRSVHPANTIKGHYRWRLYAMDRALDAGVDDVGIGALFGLYDWRFEVMGLLHHAIHLEETFDGVGPHTISFPRITPATGTPYSQHPEYAVSDEDYMKLVAVLRLSVPYTGLICTARETPEVRREVLALGVSQIDAGSRIGVGGYAESAGNAFPDKEQFSLGDVRSLDEVVRQVCETGNIASFCTACYRNGRTGEEFMGLAKSKFVHNFCIPNAIFTLKEYLLDYAGESTRLTGDRVLAELVERFEGTPVHQSIVEGLERLERGERDLFV